MVTVTGGNAPLVDELFSQLFHDAVNSDDQILADIISNLSTRARPTDLELAGIFENVAQPVSPELGGFLYALTRSLRPTAVAEFGTSTGAAALCIAAGLRDNGGGTLLSVELNADKHRRAISALTSAELTRYVDLRCGDALAVLQNAGLEFGLVLLDAWQDRYLDVLRLLEPQMLTGALVLADDIFPTQMGEYLDHVRGNGYISVPLELGTPVEMSIFLGVGPQPQGTAP